MVAFLTVHKMTKRQPAKKATGAFMAVANRHIYLGIITHQGHISQVSANDPSLTQSVTDEHHFYSVL